MIANSFPYEVTHKNEREEVKEEASSLTTHHRTDVSKYTDIQLLYDK